MLGNWKLLRDFWAVQTETWHINYYPVIKNCVTLASSGGA